METSPSLEEKGKVSWSRMAAVLKEKLLAIKVTREEEERVQYDFQWRSLYFGLCVSWYWRTHLCCEHGEGMAPLRKSFTVS